LRSLTTDSAVAGGAIPVGSKPNRDCLRASELASKVTNGGRINSNAFSLAISLTYIKMDYQGKKLLSGSRDVLDLKKYVDGLIMQTRKDR
jgi:hypothetical protein